MSSRTPAHLTLGPLLFHWPAHKRRDFYLRIADEAPIDTVYLGEVVCSKREPFFEPYRLQEEIGQFLGLSRGPPIASY